MAAEIHQITTKPILSNAGQARMALALDKLGCVYVNADGVFVVTRHGTWKGERKEWEASSGTNTGR
jgi:hypothetical protein